MYVVEFCDNKNYSPCGSDFTRIYSSLKTIKILLKLKFNGISKDITHYNIYRVSNIYNRDSYNLEKTVILWLNS